MKRIITITVIAIMFIGCHKINEDLPYQKEEDVFLRIKENGLWGFIDTSGSVIIDPQYESAVDSNEGLAAVKIDGKWGYININGEIVIEAIYDQTYWFHKGLAEARIDNKSGLIDKNGNVVIDFEYGWIWSWNNSYIQATRDNKWGILDRSGKVVIPFDYPFISNINNGYTFISTKGLTSPDADWALANHKGELLTDYIYQSTSSDSNGEHLDGYIVDPEFSEGLAAVKIDNKRCFINTKQEIVIETDFDKTHHFIEGMSLIIQDEKIGYIDKTGELAIEPQYKLHYYSQFYGGFAVVTNMDGKDGVIDKSNNIIIPFEHKINYTASKKGIFTVNLEDGSWGYLNKQNQIIWRSEVSDKLTIEEQKLLKFGQ